jgi:hypothetical protein
MPKLIKAIVHIILYPMYTCPKQWSDADIIVNLMDEVDLSEYNPIRKLMKLYQPLISKFIARDGVA